LINFLLLMLVPLIISTAALLAFKGKVTKYEFLGQVGVVAVFVAVALCIAYASRTTDQEIWNGQITSRTRDEVSCRHSYRCHCYTSCSGSGKSRSCTEVCQTCYEHSYDVDWNIHASTGEDLSIDTVDRQGLDMPPRWAKSYVGEPFSSSHLYTNYILANPESVLLGGKGDPDRFKDLIPDYPKVTDYYRVNHVINMGVPVDTSALSWLMNEANKTLGTTKQVNLLLLLVNTADPTYTMALKDVWVGGKKNDVVVVIGSLDGHKVEFVDVLSWTPRADFKVELRDAILHIGSLDQRDQIVQAITSHVNNQFERMHMKDFKYLMRSFQPSRVAMWWIFVLSTLLSFGLAIWSIVNNITDDNVGYSNRFSRSYQ
jgi:hypothetical protein